MNKNNVARFNKMSYKALTPLNSPLYQHETVIEHQERMKLRRLKEYAIDIYVSSVIRYVRNYYKHIHPQKMIYYNCKPPIMTQSLFNYYKSIGVLK